MMANHMNVVAFCVIISVKFFVMKMKKKKNPLSNLLHESRPHGIGMALNAKSSPSFYVQEMRLLFSLKEKFVENSCFLLKLRYSLLVTCCSVDNDR